MVLLLPSYQPGPDESTFWLRTRCVVARGGRDQWVGRRRPCPGALAGSDRGVVRSEIPTGVEDISPMHMQPSFRRPGGQTRSPAGDSGESPGVTPSLLVKRTCVSHPDSHGVSYAPCAFGVNDLASGAGRTRRTVEDTRSFGFPQSWLRARIAMGSEPERSEGGASGNPKIELDAPVGRL